MGKIDIHDGEMARTIRLRDLDGEIAIDVSGDGPPAVRVPEEFEIEQE